MRWRNFLNGAVSLALLGMLCVSGCAKPQIRSDCPFPCPNAEVAGELESYLVALDEENEDPDEIPRSPMTEWFLTASDRCGCLDA